MASRNFSVCSSRISGKFILHNSVEPTLYDTISQIPHTPFLSDLSQRFPRFLHLPFPSLTLLGFLSCALMVLLPVSFLLPCYHCIKVMIFTVLHLFLFSDLADMEVSSALSHKLIVLNSQNSLERPGGHVAVICKTMSDSYNMKPESFTQPEARCTRERSRNF